MESGRHLFPRALFHHLQADVDGGGRAAVQEQAQRQRRAVAAHVKLESEF